MKPITAASLVTLGSSLITAATAFAFSQASSSKTSQVALGIFTVLAASFSTTSFLGVIRSLTLSQEEAEKDVEIDEYMGNICEYLPSGSAITLFSLSTLTVIHVFLRTLESLKK